MRYVHPKYTFPAEGLHNVFHFDQSVMVERTGVFAHLMNHVDSSPRPDGLDSDSNSLQLSLSDVRKPAACDNCLFDLVAGKCTNKIAFGDLE